MSYFSIFLFICITLWNSRENFWRDPPGPPCFEKSGPSPAEKNWTPSPGHLELAHVWYVIRREPCLQLRHNLLCSKKIDLTKTMRQCTYLFFPFEVWVWFWSSIDQGESREDCRLDVAHFTTWWNTTLSHKFNPSGLLMSGKTKCVLTYTYHTDHVFLPQPWKDRLGRF